MKENVGKFIHSEDLQLIIEDKIPDEKYVSYLEVLDMGDHYDLTTAVFDAKIVSIIKEFQSKDDFFKDGSWSLSQYTWNIIKVDLLKYVVDMNEKFIFPIDEDISGLLSSSSHSKRNEYIQRSHMTPDDLEDLKKRIFQKSPYLRLYQLKNVMSYFCNQDVLHADDVGLGKTICTIAYLDLDRPMKTLIVVPSSLKLQWHDEIKKFAAC